MKKKYIFILTAIFLYTGMSFLYAMPYSLSCKIDSLNINNTEYYPLYKILNVLQLERYYDVYTQKILIKDRGRYLTFFANEYIIYYEMQTILLKSPPMRHEGIIYIPREMVDMITSWKRGDFQFQYVKNEFNISKKEEVIYKDEPGQNKKTGSADALLDKKEETYNKSPVFLEAEKSKDVSSSVSSANRIKVIIIDPGHGGRDPGAIGQKGLREKEVVLNTCLYLMDYLKKRIRNINIVMLRDTDVYMSLEQRAKMANKYADKNTGAIFLSVHANASYNKLTQGTETFVLSPVASDDEARAVAAMENGMIDSKTEKADSLTRILTGMISYENIRESIQMAEFIQKNYEKILNAKGTTPTGVKKALFYVLEGTLMPAALTEIGFLTNKTEEKLLRQTSYQKKVAIAIGEGLIQYINWYESNNGFIQ